MIRIFRSTLFYGVVVVLASLLLAQFNPQLAIRLTGLCAGVPIILAMIFSGSLNSGDRLRANYSRETQSERDQRYYLSGALFKFGIPNLLLAIHLFYKHYIP
ncbi:DUF5316 domain-containing protein [Gorillibacterium timonense]|uniref:DUF5316 domain-containing protein n=1 Tax=Gorillibacterium timonense TaxID=1689269 RepID=UPI00131A62CC